MKCPYCNKETDSKHLFCDHCESYIGKFHTEKNGAEKNAEKPAVKQVEPMPPVKKVAPTTPVVNPSKITPPAPIKTTAPTVTNMYVYKSVVLGQPQTKLKFSERQTIILELLITVFSFAMALGILLPLNSFAYKESLFIFSNSLSEDWLSIKIIAICFLITYFLSQILFVSIIKNHSTIGKLRALDITYCIAGILGLAYVCLYVYTPISLKNGAELIAKGSGYVLFLAGYFLYFSILPYIVKLFIAKTNK